MSHQPNDMNRLQVPSPDFWAITPFTISTPEGWSAKQTVDQLVYMSADGEPSTNCGVQWKRVSRNLSLQQIGGMAWRVTKRMDPDAKLQYSRFIRVNGFTAYLRLSEFHKQADADGEQMLAGQMYAALHGPDFGEGRPIELFEIIGHFEAGHPHRAAELEAILGSFEFLNVVRPNTGDADSATDTAKGA
jgi:hypothetical protein